MTCKLTKEEIEAALKAEYSHKNGFWGTTKGKKKRYWPAGEVARVRGCKFKESNTFPTMLVNIASFSTNVLRDFYESIGAPAAFYNASHYTNLSGKEVRKRLRNLLNQCSS